MVGWRCTLSSEYVLFQEYKKFYFIISNFENVSNNNYDSSTSSTLISWGCEGGIDISIYFC